MIRGTILALGAALGLASPALAQERITIGTGGTGGLFYVIGAGMAEQINDNMDGAFARAEVTGASVENIRRVAADQLTFGFSSSSTLYEGKNGQGPFEGDAQAVAAMAYLYPAVLQIAVAADSGIETIDGLAGKRISLGPPGSNSAVIAERLLAAYGVTDATPEYLSYTEGVDALLNGTVDAVTVLAGAPTAALIDLSAQRDMRLLPVDADKVAGMLEQYPFYQVTEIDAGTYEGQDAPVALINDPATIFTAEDADPALVQSIMAAVFDHLDTLAEVHPQAKAITKADAPNTPIDLHPGAQAYFDGAGN